MPALIIKSEDHPLAEWQAAFAGFDVEVRGWDAPGDAADVEYALVWQPPAGALAAYRNLKVVFSIGAGIDHLAGDGVVPPGVPVVRMVDDALTAGMTEYVVYQVLRFHRDMAQYEAQQRGKIWRELRQVAAASRRVGILGLGVLGRASATALAAFGFAVAGWSRGEKNIPGVRSFYGQEQLPAFLAQSEILVCLLPLTDETEGILCAANFAHLPRGACVINAARGGHCVEEDLLAALDGGQVSAAVLDVFRAEPLPADNALWRHPRVQVTPHIASMTIPASSAKHVMENIRRWRGGRELTHVVDFTRGF